MRNFLFVFSFLQVAKILTQTPEVATEIASVDANISIDPNILIDQDSQCSPTDQSSCDNNSMCTWDQNIYCKNKTDCTQISLEECQQNNTCTYTPPALGYCYSNISLNCGSYSKDYCLSHPLCNWNSKTKCVLKDTPDCSSLSPIQCFWYSQYCKLYGSCQDTKNFCESLTYDQCILDSKCKFNFTQYEQCLESESYCKNLNQRDCLKSKFCLGQYTAPQCVNAYECSTFNAISCKKNSQACSYKEIPYTCAPKENDCSTYSNSSDCYKAGCSFSTNSDGEFYCFYPYACEKYSEKLCKNSSNYCDYTPGSFTCSNKLDCTKITDPNLCKRNKYCKSIPSQFQCLARKESCKAYNAADCQKNSACTYIPPQGNCTQVEPFGCNSMNLFGCSNDSHCQINYQCTPKKLPCCSGLTEEQCKNSPFCETIDTGKCENHIDCNLPYEQCIVTRPCVWNPEQTGQCANQFDCKGLPTDDCKKNDTYCTYENPFGCIYKGTT